MIRSILTAALIALVAVDATAEVTRVDISRRADVGISGYEKIVGTIHFAIDPKHPDNRVIVGLDKAPRNGAGQVEFSADLYILQPREAWRSNGVALVDVVNRGLKTILTGFSRGGILDPATEADLGDGFLTRLGYTLVWVGWQFDVPRASNLMGIAAPHALGVTTTVRAEFTPNDNNPDVTVTDLAGYPAIGDASDASLTVRDGPFGEREEIPRQQFRLRANVVSLAGGFEPGRTYQLSYRTENPAVAGVGLVAVRDTASWLKRDPSAPSHPRYTIAFGSSQGGRFLRTFLYQGFNTDERGRQVFDGVIAHSAGAARLSVNEEGATPNSLDIYAAPAFPHSDTVQKDPLTGRKDGLLENARGRGQAPKVFYTNSSAEYWSRGRSAALIHSLSGPYYLDEKLPRNVRLYLFAGTQHAPDEFPPQNNAAQQQLGNPVQYWWSMRALLVAMTRWVKDVGDPPPSSYPRSGYFGEMPSTMTEAFFFGGTVDNFPNPPGVQTPEILTPRRTRQRDYVPLRVSSVNPEHGNEISGIRMPDVAVPLATYTGWNFRTPEVGAPNELVPLAGSMLPFAATVEQRFRARDPRLSVEERYKSKDEYLQKVRRAADDLVNDRYLLADDVAPIVARAGETWDWVVGSR